jgi:hypothetical protein
MHKCVCIWWFILQNYNYKLHFQNLFIYHIPHVSIGPWLLKILMFALLVTREIATYNWPWEKTGDSKYMLGLLLILISKSWGCPPPPLGPGMPFLDSDTCTEGGVIYFCPGFLPSMMSSMDGWQAGWMDGKLHEKQPWPPLLNVISSVVVSAAKSAGQSPNYSLVWTVIAIYSSTNSTIFRSEQIFSVWGERRAGPEAIPWFVRGQEWGP